MLKVGLGRLRGTVKLWLIRRWGLMRTRSRFTFAGSEIVVPEGVLNPTMMRSSLFFAEQCQRIAREWLAEARSAKVEVQKQKRFHALELGCGCGLASLVLAQQGGRVTALDSSLVAALATESNLRRNGCSARVLVSDWDSALAENRRFDVVVLNPPFLAESLRESADQWLQSALFSGDNHEILRAAIVACERRLTPDGFAIMLTSERSGEDEVRLLVKHAGLRFVGSLGRTIQGERFIVHTLQRTPGVEKEQ